MNINIKKIIESMSIEEKAGQLLVVDFTGTTITPHLKKLITEYNCAGLRVQPNSRVKAVYHHGALDAGLTKERSYRHPKDGCKDLAFTDPAPRCSALEYASILNELKDMGLNRKSGIPLHIVFDQEGTGFDNFNCGNVKLFPPQMGMAAIQDLDTVYEVYRAYAHQLKCVGLNWIHSPVLDVMSNPQNLEVGLRSFSSDTDTVVKYAKVMLQAFKDEKLIATGKHFPGRGESNVDAHLDLPVIDINLEALIDEHVKPYKELIDMGLPAIMIAHTIYPALEKMDIPATVSYQIITKFLREELGFQGAVTTDNLLMNGLIKKYEIPQAAVMAIQAGATLLLPRAESSLIDEIYYALVDAIKSGELSISTVDQAIEFNLKVKQSYGLFENGGKVDINYADTYQNSDYLKEMEKKAARESVVLLRDRENLLPICKEDKILLIDQVGQTQLNMNNRHCHPGVFWEILLKKNKNVHCVEVLGEKQLSAETRERVMNRLNESDIIIFVAYNPHKDIKLNVELLDEVQKTGKKVVLITNSPYQVDKNLDTVIITFTDATASLEVAADIVFGDQLAIGKLPVHNCY